MMIDVVQLTPRRSFDVARAFDENKQLRYLCTDFALPSKTLAKAILPKRVTSDRYCVDLKSGKLLCSYATGVRFRYSLSRRPQHQKYISQIRASKDLASFYLRKTAKKFPEADGVYCLDGSALEVFEAKPDEFKILEQCVAPRATQLAAMKRYSDTQDVALWQNHFDALSARERKEWQMADVVLAPSEFVYNELLTNGVPESKLRLLPYWTPFEPLPKQPAYCGESFTVLFVGNDARRKGLEDVFKIAAELSNQKSLSFKIIGAVADEYQQLKENYALSNVDYLGILSHKDLKDVFKKSQIFLLPSYLEGSSVAVYEAMACGLVAIASHQSGSIIEHGVSGFVFEAGEILEPVRYINELISQTDRMTEMSGNALSRVSSFRHDNYSQRLLSIVNSLQSVK